MTNIEKLIDGAAKCGITVDKDQAALMIRYMELLLEKNEQINVTSIKDPDEFIEKHLIDSLTCLRFIGCKNGLILDVGTGGGFPGVPLAIMLPAAEITMMDSTGKKLKVIEEICETLELKNINILHGRAEEFGQDPAYREGYDVVVSRAVANLRLLSEFCLPLVKKHGQFIALKGKNYAEEMPEGEKTIEILGGKIKAVEFCSLLQTDLVHVIIMVDKIESTPARYPRSFGKMKKDPVTA